MTLEEARELVRTRGGEIRAFALRRASLERIAYDCTNLQVALKDRPLGYPIVVVGDNEPEGVIV